MLTLIQSDQTHFQVLFSRAAHAYVTDCCDHGLAPAPISVFTSRLSEHFVEQRTGTNGKSGVCFPATKEGLSYLDPPREEWA